MLIYSIFESQFNSLDSFSVVKFIIYVHFIIIIIMGNYNNVYDTVDDRLPALR